MKQYFVIWDKDRRGLVEKHTERISDIRLLPKTQ